MAASKDKRAWASFWDEAAKIKWSDLDLVGKAGWTEVAIAPMRKRRKPIDLPSVDWPARIVLTEQLGGQVDIRTWDDQYEVICHLDGNTCGQRMSAMEWRVRQDEVRCQRDRADKLLAKYAPWEPEWRPAPIEVLYDDSSNEPFIDNPNNPQEEAIMGFSKKKQTLPERIQDLDFQDLSGPHVRVLAEWMGVRRAVHRAYTEGGKEKGRIDSRNVLREACARDWARAQKGYDTICLGKTDDGVQKEKDENDTVKALYSTVAELLNEHRDTVDGVAKERVESHVTRALANLEKFAKEALEKAAEKKAPIVIKNEGKIKKIKGVLPPEFQRMLELASARIPIMLVGPAGCGKTYLCEKLAEALDMEFSDQSCSEGMSESVFNGLLLPIGKGGAFDHVTTPYMERYETGGVMLLDEIDAGDPNLFTYINKSIANSSYTVPQRWQKPVVKKHRDFVLVAAANTFGHGADSMYVGRNQLDAATLDRFKVGLITMDYSREVEEALAPKELCEWAWNVRDKIRTNKIRRVMSTRVIENLGKMTERYKWSTKEWESAYFTGWSEADRRLVA